MRVLLLSNGPSLDAFDGEMRYHDHVIAVTKAATRFPCHYWVVGDDEVFTNLPNLVGEPMYVFMNKAISVHKGPDYFREAREWLKTRNIIRWINVPNARGYSGPAAFALARWILNACDHEDKQIDVYGADMSGVSDCAGHESERCRSEGRWARERRDWEAIESLCESEGISVRLHRHATQPA